MFARATYKVPISILVNTYGLYFTTCLVYTGPAPNEINEAYERLHSKCFIKLCNASRLLTSTKNSMNGRRRAPLILKRKTLQVRTLLDVVENLSVDIFLSADIQLHLHRRNFLPDQENQADLVSAGVNLGHIKNCPKIQVHCHSSCLVHKYREMQKD